MNCISYAAYVAYSMNHTTVNSTESLEHQDKSTILERFANSRVYIYTFDFSILIFDLVDQTALERPGD